MVVVVPRSFARQNEYMINDLDSTLEVLLRHTAPHLVANRVAISFAPPDNSFPPASVALPAIDLFLYEVRENREFRSNERVAERGKDGTVTLLPPPVRVDCSYLITAWPSPGDNAIKDEHSMISEVMAALLRYPVLPRQLLQGTLANQPLPPPVTALQAGSLQSMGEFWQALGGKPKVALHYTVTIAVQAGLGMEEGPPIVDSRIRVDRANTA
jgi:hypothetical protein